MTTNDKITMINDSLESIRDIMLGLDKSIVPYTLDKNNNLDKQKVFKLVDTLLFYIMQENPLYNKEDLKFFRYSVSSMIFFTANIEAMPLEHMTFKMLLSTADIIDSDPETYSELISNAYFTLKPDFMLANLDDTNIKNPSNLTEEDLSHAKLTVATKAQEKAIRKQWEEKHLNSKLADEILEYNQKLFESYDSIPDDFYPAFEMSLYKFLNDEELSFFDEKYLNRINSSLMKAIEKKNNPETK